MGKRGKGKKKTDAGAESAIEDPRFNQMHSDPRFARMPTKERKFKVDDRFKAMFSDPAFVTESKRDKYGRAVEQKEAGEDLKRFYQVDESEDDMNSMERELIGMSASEEEETEPVADDAVSCSSESESDSDSDATAEEDITVYEAAIPMGDETKRIAIVNQNWDTLRALDLLHVLNSACPEGGRIEAVTVHPSDYGLEQMEIENKMGPQGIWNEAPVDEDRELFHEDEGHAFDEKKLRAYELQRLRYYYAVAEFDCIQTAAHVYNECDCIEFESSGNKLDLRFVPDDVSFADRAVRDRVTASDLNAETYKAPEFDTKALGHSKVSLSWDTDDIHRTKLCQTTKSVDDSNENDFAAYIASENDSEAYGSDAVVEVGEEKSVLKRRARSKYAGLLDMIQHGSEDEEEEEMEIIFQSGFQTKEALTVQDDEKDTSIYDEVDPQDLDDPFFQGVFDDEKEQQTSKKKKKENVLDRADVEQQKKELELLALSTGDADENGYDLQDLVERNKVKKGLKKKSKKKKGVEEKTDSFEMDLKDPRFEAVFDHPDFAVDPTAPQYKATEKMEEMLVEKQKRRQEKRSTMEKMVRTKRQRREEQPLAEKKSNHISSLVAKLRK